MNYKALIFISLFGFPLISGSCSKKNPDKESNETSPNILYIFTDDQSIRTLQSYPQAQKWVNTPNIDKLAKQGVRFQNSYTGAKCVPSRGNALTGKFQSNYSKSTAYWPVEFRKQGYYTGMIGKWHWDLPRHDETWDWSAVWEHYLPENHKNYYYDQELRMHGDSLMDLNGYTTDRYTDLTIEFLKERALDPDQPWYFWLCYGGVHGPYTPADRHMDLYLDQPEVDIPVDVFGPRPDKPEYMFDMSMWKKDDNGKPIHRDRPLDSWVKQYNQAVKSIDEGLGRIVKTLEETGQIDNTIIIFTSDNGIKTIHSLCNIAPSGNLDGRDFTELLKNPGIQEWSAAPMIQIYTGSLYGDDAIYTALTSAHASGDWKKFVVHDTGIRAWMMMRKDHYKYVRYIYKDYIEELYDLKNDPEELHNLAVDKNYHSQLEQYRNETIDLFKANGASFLDLLPEPKIISR